MAWIVRMPKLGQTMETGLLQEWLADEGDFVERDQPLAVIETDKFTEELEAREPGVLRRIVASEGEELPPGEPIAIVAGAEEDLPDLEDDSEEPRKRSDGSVPNGSDGTSAADPSEENESPEESPERVKASPAARAMAERRGVDLSPIEGTGVEGAVTTEDVERCLNRRDEGDEPDSPTMTPREVRTRTSMRETIARRLRQSYREAVHVTLNKEIAVEELVDFHEDRTQQSEVDVSLTDLILAALVPTLDDHPDFNAVYEEDEHRLIEEKNIGIAVDLNPGLITPVLPDLGERSLEAIARGRRSLIRRVKKNNQRPADLENGTFTITNLGALGIDTFDPIIDPPQVGILGIGRQRQRAVPGEEPEVPFRFRAVMNCSLTFDHRVVDGADAARFLSTLKEYLQRPEELPAVTR